MSPEAQAASRGFKTPVNPFAIISAIADIAAIVLISAVIGAAYFGASNDRGALAQNAESQLDPNATRSYILSRVIDYFTLQIAEDPTNADNYFERAHAYDRLGAAQQAIEDYRTAARLGYKRNFSRSAYGETALQTGFLDAGVVNFKQSVDTDSPLKLTYYELSKYKSFIAELTKAIELGVNSAAIYAARCEAYAAIEYYSAAIDDCTEALRLDPSLSDAHFERARANFELKNYAQSIEDLTNLIDFNSSNWAAYNLRSGASLALDDFDGAIKDALDACRLGNCAALEALNQSGLN